MVGKLGCNREQVSSDAVSPGNGKSAKSSDGKLKLRWVTYLFPQDKILDASSKLAHHFKSSSAFLNEADAKNLGVANGDVIRLSGNGTEIDAELTVDNRCMDGGVVVPKVSDEQGINGLLKLDGSTWVDIKKV